MHSWDKHTPIDETMRALDDLVKTGKIRYVGFSDVPAWKITEAAMIAKMYGWTPLIALQLEYSLLERTIEGEHVPLAREFGFGITPWSPLKQGALSGKFTRANIGKAPAGRGDWVTAALDEKAYDVVDALVEIAKENDSTPARVALNWVKNRPGITSTIIGARTMIQLEDNLAALELKLTSAQNDRLNVLTSPKLNFPAQFLENAGSFSSSGTTINGEVYAINPIAPVTDAERF